MNEQNFVHRVLVIVGIVTFVVLTILLTVYAVDALMLAFAGILLAVFFRGLSNLVSKYTGLGSGLSFAIVILTLVGVLAISIYFLEQSVADQIGELRQQLPQAVNTIRGNLEQYSWGRSLIQQIPPTDVIFDTIRSANLLSRASGFFSSTVGIFTNFFIFLVLAIFIAIEPQTYIRGILLLVPRPNRERARQTLDALGETLRWWLVGQFGSMTTIGVLTFIGLYFLGVPLALGLAVITALLTFIPNLGPILSLIPALLLGLAQSPTTALYVIILYLGVQAIESNLVTPYIQRQTVNLPPALTTAVQLILGVFVGGLGVVLAAPLVACGIVLVQMLYVEDVLGERVRTVDEKSKGEFVKKEEATVGVEKAKGNLPETKTANATKQT